MTKPWIPTNSCPWDNNTAFLFFFLFDGHRPKNAAGFPAAFELVEKGLRPFPPDSAACCAHNLFAVGEQIPHLQSERCFRPRTRRGQKRFGLYSPPVRRTLRGSVKRTKKPPVSRRLFLYLSEFSLYHSRFLFTMPEKCPKSCLFCTGKHVSVCRFTQFCSLTKINVAYVNGFMYNVLIVVSSTYCHEAEG